MKATRFITFFAATSALFLNACLATSDPTGSDTADSQGTYKPQTIEIAVDTDWDAVDVSTDDSADAVDFVEKSHRGHTVPTNAAVVELDIAEIYVASVGFKQLTQATERREQRPEGERPERPDGPPQDHQAFSEPESEPTAEKRHRKERPEIDIENLDNQVFGPFVLDLLAGEIPAELSDVALIEESRYMAILFPVTDSERNTIYVEGSFANEETDFEFVIQADFDRPVLVPIFSNDYSEHLTAHVHLAAALAHADLSKCIDSENTTEDGAYIIDDLKECRIRADHLRRRPRPNDRRDDVEIICEGSEEWCREMTERRPRREEICVVDFARSEDRITITITEASDDCTSIEPPIEE